MQETIQSNLVNDSTPPPVIEPEKPTLPIVPVLVGIVLVASLSTAGFFGYQYNQLKRQLNAANPAPPTPTPLETPAVTPPAPTNSAANPTFQQILAEKCTKVIDGNVTLWTIKPTDLPLKFSNLVSRNLAKPHGSACSFWDESSPANKSQNSVTIRLADNTVINLYDRNSYEGGHGGPAIFGSLGTVIKTDSDITLSIDVAWPHGGEPEIGTTGILLRGEKRFVLDNGDKVFANMQLMGVEGDDNRWITALKPLGHSCEFDQTKQCFDNQSNPAELAHTTFFHDMDNLNAKEKARVDQIIALLNAVTK